MVEIWRQVWVKLIPDNYPQPTVSRFSDYFLVCLVPHDSPDSANACWYDFQPGHQPVCHFQSRDINDFGLDSAFIRNLQVAQDISSDVAFFLTSVIIFSIFLETDYLERGKGKFLFKILPIRFSASI